MLSARGLSPRLRGNLPQPETYSTKRRSIPAPAGEPGTGGPTRGHSPVYPRACGGTDDTCLWHKGRHGLSPRLRGNRLKKLNAGLRARSIPAPAGEPGRSWLGRCPAWVYPRACGGTKPMRRSPVSAHGLSPRLRGNPTNAPVASQRPRSIPAPAGEPFPASQQPIPQKVYPRACGGTIHRSIKADS